MGSIFLVLGVVTTFEVDLKVKGLLNELFSSHDLWLHVVWHSLFNPPGSSTVVLASV